MKNFKMDKIDTIIKALKVICEDNFETHPSADMVLDCATRIYLTGVINKAKSTTGNIGDKATEKQIIAMRNMNIPYTIAMTKEEAKGLISKKIDSFN